MIHWQKQHEKFLISFKQKTQGNSKGALPPYPGVQFSLLFDSHPPLFALFTYLIINYGFKWIPSRVFWGGSYLLLFIFFK